MAFPSFERVRFRFSDRPPIHSFVCSVVHIIVSLCARAPFPDEDPARAPSRILLVSIFNAMAPVSTDILFQNFSECGRVGKIILFEKHFGRFDLWGRVLGSSW